MSIELCLDDLDDDALDRLPFGVIRLGPTGTVERFNRTEAQRSGVQRWRVLGRNYFRDVAGLSAAPLAERIGSLAAGSSERVFHTFRGYHRTDDAVVDISRCEAGRVYLCIRTT